MKSLLLAGVIAVAMAAGAVTAGAANSNPRVLPPTSAYGGETYGDRSAEWWQWALSAPASVNPLLDSTGANCAQGQNGRVWFLAGTFGPGTATRSCSVPAGTALFFPVVNAFSAEEGTVEEERASVAAFIDSVTAMSATIDGRPVQNLEAYRATSPVFGITLPEDNIFGAEARTYSPTVSDGYWLMLAPLAPGPHVVDFAAEVDGSFSLDVTYNLFVQT